MRSFEIDECKETIFGSFKLQLKNSGMSLLNNKRVMCALLTD